MAVGYASVVGSSTVGVHLYLYGTVVDVLRFSGEGAAEQMVDEFRTLLWHVISRIHNVHPED